jgi:CubicO group peptidase (beta-lactamase class C family)
MRKAILILTFSLLIALNAIGQRLKQHAHIDQAVNEAASKFMSDPDHIGLSIGIIKGGEKYSYNFGTIEKGKNIKPSAHTVYEIASVTKSFTGILLAHAIIENRIALTDSIQKYIRSLNNLTYQGTPVTIFNLASHTSGLPKFVPIPPSGLAPVDYWATHTAISEEDFLDELARIRLKHKPGAAFIYSNADTQLLGVILERIYRISFADLVKKYITGPGHMKNTGIAIPDTTEFAKGYDGKGKLAPRLTWWDKLPAAASLRSDLDDMLNYLQLNLNESDPAIGLAHKPIQQITDEGAESIALYWLNKKTKKGYREIFHAGGSAGHTSFCLVCPQTQTGIVCFANDASPDTEHAIKAMANEILNAIN